MTPDNLAAGKTDKVGDGHTFANIFSMWFRSMRYTSSCSRRSGLASKIVHLTAGPASEEADSASQLSTDGFDDGCDEAAFGSEMNRQERGNTTCTLRCLLTLGGTGCGNRLEVLGRRWSAPVRILVWAFFSHQLCDLHLKVFCFRSSPFRCAPHMRGLTFGTWRSGVCAVLEMSH